MALIAVVDDDPVFCKIVTEFLSDLGHEISVAPGIAQLSVLIKLRRPDAAIVDMQMPSGGGPAAVRLLREQVDPRLPILICSGMPEAASKKWFANAPRLTTMQKPADLPALAAELDRLMRED